ncbi:RIP metalloprotease RseP, partial [Pseudomonas sp. 2822-15]
MNFVLAVFVLILYAAFAGMPVNEALVGDVTEDGVAIEAGIESGDRIISIEGQQVSTWDEMTTIIQSKPNEPLLFEIQRDS